MDLLSIYLLNLIVTVGMFIVLIFRAWIELKNYKMMWKELEWKETYRAVGRVLKAEKIFSQKLKAERNSTSFYAKYSRFQKTKPCRTQTICQ